MRLPDKTTTLEEAVAQIDDGATVMVGGFGVPGTPVHADPRAGAPGPAGT